MRHLSQLLCQLRAGAGAVFRQVGAGIPDLLLLAGVYCVASGVWLWSPPAGRVVLGLLLLLAGLRLARTEGGS